MSLEPSHEGSCAAMGLHVLTAGFAIGQPSPSFWIFEVPESLQAEIKMILYQEQLLLSNLSCLFLHGS